MFHLTAICRQTESRTLHVAYFSTMNVFASCKFILLLSFKNEVVIYLTRSNNNNNNNNNNSFLISRKLTSEYDQMHLTTITTCKNYSKHFSNRTIERSVLLSLVIDHDNRRVSNFARLQKEIKPIEIYTITQFRLVFWKFFLTFKGKKKLN